MLHGNLLLHGWALADVSFYTTDMPQYMLVEAVRGLSPDVVHIAAALTYTLLVLLAGWLAKGRATGPEGIARALVASGIMLAPEYGAGTRLLLFQPDHIATCVPLLAAWLLVDRAGSLSTRWPRWLAPVLIAGLLTWAVVGDPLAELIGALPLAAVCAMRAYRAVLVRGQRLSACRAELSLGGAALVSVPAASLVTGFIAASGGWTATPARTTFAAASMWPHNAVLTGQGLLRLFGADFTGQPLDVQALFALVHLAGAGLAVWACCLAARRFLTAELLVQVLTTAIAINVAAYTLTVQAGDISRTREMAAVLPFGAVLAGRLLAGRLLPARLAPGLAVLLAAYAGMVFADVVQPPVPASTADLAAWLAAHDLTQGLAGYWQANIVTLDSRNAVQVRAVAMNRGKLVDQSYWDGRPAWYDPATHDADFVVSTGTTRWQDQPLIRQAEAAAGRPAVVYHFGPYTIAVWHRNLLSRLR
jgi:hypothetical protein